MLVLAALRCATLGVLFVHDDIVRFGVRDRKVV